MKGKGCGNCSNTGYRGRFGVFEIFVIDDEARKLIYEKSYADDHLATAVRHYLRWRDIRGTYERCYEPSRLVIDLAGM